MREIKFRAWDSELKRMVTEMSVSQFETVNGYFQRVQPIYKIMQYTGLKDRNSKEIYEGDIVKASKGKGTIIKIAVIKWDFPAAFWLMVDGWDKGAGGLLYGELEVIGNIWEHPELLTTN